MQLIRFIPADREVKMFSLGGHPFQVNTEAGWQRQVTIEFLPEDDERRALGVDCIVDEGSSFQYLMDSLELIKPKISELPVDDRDDMYLEEQGTKCPYCDSEQIEGGSLEINGTDASQPMGCVDCGRSWEIKLHFSYLRLIDAPEVGL